MSARDTGPRLDRAVEFAMLANRGGVQDWMLWDGWLLHVGCGLCAGGADAGCWGRADCHGYGNDCGCRDCAETQDADVAGFCAACSHEHAADERCMCPECGAPSTAPGGRCGRASCAR